MIEEQEASALAAAIEKLKQLPRYVCMNEEHASSEMRNRATGESEWFMAGGYPDALEWVKLDDVLALLAGVSADTQEKK